jgi:hypothetical protein
LGFREILYALDSPLGTVEENPLRCDVLLTFACALLLNGLEHWFLETEVTIDLCHGLVPLCVEETVALRLQVILLDELQSREAITTVGTRKVGRRNSRKGWVDHEKQSEKKGTTTGIDGEESKEGLKKKKKKKKTHTNTQSRVNGYVLDQDQDRERERER